MTKTITPKVNIVNLMAEMASTCNSFPCTIGVRMAVGCLERIAKRVCELNDPELLKELTTLGLVEEKSDSHSKTL